MKSLFCSRLAGALSLLFLVQLLVNTANAQSLRPTSEELLPENTVAYVQLKDFQEFVADLQNTNMGRMMQDEKIAPLVGDLYSQARDAFTDFEGEIGLAWEDIEQLPHGEICFAVIAPRRADTQFVLIIDVNPDSEAADHVLGRVQELAEEDGQAVEEETVEEVVYKTINSDGVGAGVMLTQFRMLDTIIITSDRKLAEEIVVRWNGGEVEKVRPLKENRKFVTIMNRCRGTKDVPPEMRFFVDPIELVRSVSRSDVGTQTALNFLPLLGLDGLLGIGGAAIFDELEFESVTHMHLLLANPRNGILEMLALKPGDYKPEPWVTEDITLYASGTLDAPKFYSELTKIVNGFMGEDGFESQVQTNINDQLEIDFQEDVIGALSGRLSFAQWIEESDKFNAQSSAFGIGIKDLEKAQMVLEKIKNKIEEESSGEEERIVLETYEGVDFWRVNFPGRQERLERMREEGQVRVSIRAPEPCFGFIGDSFVFTDNYAYMEKCIDTYKENQPGLNANEDFIDVTNRVTRLLGTDVPCGVFYSQPGPSIEWMLKLAKSDDTRGLLEEGAAENEYVERLRKSLDDHPLPTFGDIEKYFKPSGGFFTADDTGYHWLQFQVRGDE